MSATNKKRELAIAHAVRAAALESGWAVKEVSNLKRLGGGASKENWHAVIRCEGGDREVVIRLQPESWRFEDSQTIGLASEAKLVRLAGANGVPVPEVLFDLPNPFEGYVMDKVEGEARGHRIVSDVRFSNFDESLAYQCGRILSRIHVLEPASDELHEADPAAAVRNLRLQFDKTEQARPVFEIAFNWLEDNLPEASTLGLVHGDFRNGNLMMGPAGVAAVLDWETAHIGNPIEDLGWLCVTSWRFQRPDRPVGGFGERSELLAGYRDEGGGKVDLTDIHFWETFGTLRWGIMCCQVAKSFESGIRSVESAVIARRASETEWDLLGLIDDRAPHHA